MAKTKKKGMSKKSKAVVKKIISGIRKDFEKAKKQNIAAGGTGSFADIALKSLNDATDRMEATATYDDFKDWRAKHKLNDDELRNVINNDPKTKREIRAHNDYLKTFEGKTFEPAKRVIGDQGVDLFNQAVSMRRQETLKTPEQEEAVRSQIEGLLDQPAYRDVQLGQRPGAEPQAGITPAGPQPASQVVADQLRNLIGQATPPPTPPDEPRDPDKPAAKEDQPTQQPELIRPIAQELINIGQQAYERGAPEIPRFGVGRPQSPRLRAYDELINRMRPERTTAQRAAAALAPYGTQGGASLGQIIGTALGGPGLGTVAGGAAGALGGLGLGTALSRLSRPEPELAKLGRLISGTRAGWLRGGTRGLAGLISGEDPRSTLRTGFGLFRRRAPQGRVGRLRQRLGSGVRTAGEWLGQPGRAEQIRSGLEIGEAAIDLGRELGLGRLLGRGARGLGQRLGIFPQEPQYTPQGDLAGMAINPVLAGFVPALQQQAERYMGRPLPAEMFARGLDAQMLAAIGPQLASQEIKQSAIRGKRQALAQRKAGIEVNRATQEALSRLTGQQQEQAFGRAVRREGLRGREMVERARMQAQRNQLAQAEALSGQQVRLQMPLERIPQQPGAAEALMATAGAVQQATTPFVQSRIMQALNQPAPIQVNPVATSPTRLTSSDYDVSIT